MATIEKSPLAALNILRLHFSAKINVGLSRRFCVVGWRSFFFFFFSKKKDGVSIKGKVGGG